MTSGSSSHTGPAHKLVEAGVTLLIALFGVIVIAGSMKAGVNWGAEGPRAGFFPFYIGIFIVASSKADFDLAPSGFILSLFAGMILLEGLATAWAIERLGRGSLPAPHPRAVGYAVLGTTAALGFVALGASVSDLV